MSSLLRLWLKGWGPWLIQVTPPDGEPGHELSLANMGKAPGFPGLDDLWHPLSVAKATGCRSRRVVEQWIADGANAGLCMGRSVGGKFFAAIDNDTDDPATAAIIDQAIRGFFEMTFTRTVDHPKHCRTMFLFRITDVAPANQNFTARHPDSRIARWQIISTNKQFVAAGRHAKTRCPYLWTPELPGPDDVPSLTVAQFGELLKTIEAALAAQNFVMMQYPTGSASASQRVTCDDVELSLYMSLLPNDGDFDDHDSWFAVMAAIKVASNAQDWGLRIWLDWCAQCDQPQPDAPRRIWNANPLASLKSSGLGAILHLLHMRYAHDPEMLAKLAAIAFRNVKPDDNPMPPETPIKDDLLQNLVLIDASGRVLFRGDEPMDRETFNVKHHKLLPRLLTEMRLRKPYPKTIIAALSTHAEFQTVHNVTYAPGKPWIWRCDGRSRTYVNLCKPGRIPVHKPSDDDVRRYIDFVGMVIGDDKLAWGLLRWWSVIIQHPDIKAGHHYSIATREGLGKDTMLMPVVLALGEDNVQTLAPHTLAETHDTTWMMHRLLVVEETRQIATRTKSARDVHNDLKVYLTPNPPWVDCRRMYFGVFSIPNMMNWMFYTNEPSPMALGADDRRICLINNRNAALPENRYEFYRDYLTWQAANLEVIADWFLTRPLAESDIGAVLDHAPWTAAKEALAADNEDVLVQLLRAKIDDAFEQGPPLIICTMDEVTSYLDSRMRGRTPGPAVIARALRELDVRPVREPKSGNGAGVIRIDEKTTARLWLLAPKDAKGVDYASMSEAALASLYERSIRSSNESYDAVIIPFRKPESGDGQDVV